MIGGGAPVARRAETARMAVLDASYDNDICTNHTPAESQPDRAKTPAKQNVGRHGHLDACNCHAPFSHQ